MWEKAGIRFDALSAGLPEKNKLVDKVSELQTKTEEVRYNTVSRNRILRSQQMTSLWRFQMLSGGAKGCS